MKRKLFFWLEKLKISRNERYAVFSLMILLASLASINAVIVEQSPLDDKRYAQLDRHFKARTAQMSEQNRKLLARYHPRQIAPVKLDTTTRDTVEKKKAVPRAKPRQTNLINVNTASEKILQQLKGIGPAYARRIVEYRQQNGGFKTKGELIKIKGIGKKRLANIKPFIKLTGQ